MTGNGSRWMGLLCLPSGETGGQASDRRKIGAKRSVLTEGGGVPIGLAVERANRYDVKMVRETVESISGQAAGPDPGYAPRNGQRHDDDEGVICSPNSGSFVHIRARGRGQSAAAGRRVPARRWSWSARIRMNRFRRCAEPLVQVRNDLGFLHLACAYITYRQSGLLG